MFGKIMVVDDAKVVRTSLGRIVKRLGYALFEAENGEEALKVAGENPDLTLIFLDINMPVMGGLEFLERYRGDGGATPVVIVSTETDVSMIIKALSLGANEYVMKPFDEGIIRDKLGLLGIEFQS